MNAPSTAHGHDAEMSSPRERVSRRCRRYLRLSVRGLVVLVLVTGAGLGWVVRSARTQREAVGAIRKARGQVFYDWQSKNGRLIGGRKPWGPKWLQDAIGVDYFGNVTEVIMIPRVSDRELFHIGKLGQLQDLIVADTSEVTDAGLAHLKGPTNLRKLRLLQSKITDAGLVHLTRMTNLSVLKLGYAQVTDAGLIHLKGLTNLSELGLSGTQVTDAGLAHLKGLTNLTKLELDFTRIADAGLVHLKGMPNLSKLALGWTQVTDLGLVHLGRMTKLQRIGLADTRVTDAGLVHLRGLSSLRSLELRGTWTTDRGVKLLEQALPSVVIFD